MRSPDKLELAVIEYQQGRLTESALARTAYPTIRNVGRGEAIRAGVGDEEEDVTQMLWVMLVSKIAPAYDPTRPIYPMLTAYARNLANNVAWNRRSTPQLPEIFEPDHEGENTAEMVVDYLGSMWGTESAEMIEDINRKDALEKAARLLGGSKANAAPHHGIMPGVRIEAVVVAAEPQSTEPKAAKPKKPRLSKSQSEFREIRLSLGLSRREMADHINTTSASIAAWESGRTKQVPDYFLQAARDLKKNSSNRYALGLNAYGGRKMAEILAAWCKALRMDINDTETLADLFAVSEPTVRRWRNDKVKPPIDSLLEYEALVNAEKRRMELQKSRS
jgi:DNA-binding transcriptional regulator YiaG